jgi:hypothetical protein
LKLGDAVHGKHGRAMSVRAILTLFTYAGEGFSGGD